MSLNLEVVNTQVEFEFPLQVTGTTAVKEVLIRPINDKYQYKIEASYTIKTHSQQPQQ